MADHIGLYYPFSEFKDDSWVKLAALYWDKLGRIAPGGYHSPRDSETVQQLTEELGFIRNFHPGKKEMDAVGNMFLEVLNKHGHELTKHYGISSANLQDIYSLPHSMPPIFSEKLGGVARLNFIQKGLAIPVDNGSHQMHPKLAFVYLEVLAEQMASNRQIHPVVDSTLSHLAVSGYTVERLTQALLVSNDLRPHLVDPHVQSDEIEVKMATIALQTVLPHDLAQVPTKKIIKFRNKYRDEMTVFQDYIHGLVNDLGNFQGIDDPKALEAHLETTYERVLKPQLSDLKKCLKSLGIDTVMGAMNIRVVIPPLFASTGSLLHLAPLNPLVVGAGAIAFSLFPVIQKKQTETKQIVRSSPAAYLLYLQEGLMPANLVSQVTRTARQMIFRV
jgi:Family of unknown function (DUF6236)